jgi:hypothetical protein
LRKWDRESLEARSSSIFLKEMGFALIEYFIKKEILPSLKIIDF